MQIAVTGARGQLGGELCRQLENRAIPLDHAALDVTDGLAVQQTLRRLKPAAVIHCAAYNRVDQAETQPDTCWAVNVAAVQHLVRVCDELDCPLVHVSSNYVFGGGVDPGRPFREDDPPAPQGVYARSKLEGEQVAARHRQHLIVRTCGLYARPGDQRAQSFLSTMLRLGGQGGNVGVVSDQCCTPSYVPHVARAILFLVGATAPRPAPWGIYHVTNGGSATWYEFAAELFRQAGVEVVLRPITTAEYGAAAPRPSYSVLDTTAYQRLGGPPLPDWKAALAEYFGEHKCHNQPTQKSP
jgi:dTDP-4-dehydrorhamnose reductase